MDFNKDFDIKQEVSLVSRKLEDISILETFKKDLKSFMEKYEDVKTYGPLDLINFKKEFENGELINDSHFYIMINFFFKFFNINEEIIVKNYLIPSNKIKESDIFLKKTFLDYDISDVVFQKIEFVNNELIIVYSDCNGIKETKTIKVSKLDYDFKIDKNGNLISLKKDVLNVIEIDYIKRNKRIFFQEDYFFKYSKFLEKVMNIAYYWFEDEKVKEEFKKLVHKNYVQIQ